MAAMLSVRQRICTMVFASKGASRAAAAAVVLLLFAPGQAQAGTIHTLFFDSAGSPVPGTITATLDVWARSRSTGQLTLVSSLSLGIGSDFTVVIPRAVIDSHAAWQNTIPHGNSPFDWSQALPGLSGVSMYPFGFSSGIGTDVADLADWCSNPGVGFVNGIFVMALRSDCAFSQKVENIEASNGVGALIVNDIPNAGAPGISLTTLNPGIPVVGLSYERGAQLIVLDADNIVYIDFEARWDPDPTDVPEPTSLMLLSGGIVALTAVRRSRGRSGQPHDGRRTRRAERIPHPW
jgi:hypothetical protein